MTARLQFDGVPVSGAGAPVSAERASEKSDGGSVGSARDAAKADRNEARAALPFGRTSGRSPILGAGKRTVTEGAVESPSLMVRTGRTAG